MTTKEQREKYGTPYEWWRKATAKDKDKDFGTFINETIQVKIQQLNNKIADKENGVILTGKIGASVARAIYVSLELRIPLFDSTRVPRKNKQVLELHRIKLLTMQDFVDVIFEVEDAIVTCQIAARGLNKAEQELIDAERIHFEAKGKALEGKDKAFKEAELLLEKAKINSQKAKDIYELALSELDAQLGFVAATTRITLSQELLSESFRSHKPEEQLKRILKGLGLKFTKDIKRTLLAQLTGTEELIARTVRDLAMRSGDTKIAAIINPQVSSILGVIPRASLEFSSEDSKDPTMLWHLYFAAATERLIVIDRLQYELATLKRELVSAREEREHFKKLAEGELKRYYEITEADYREDLIGFDQRELARNDLMQARNLERAAHARYKVVRTRILERSVGVEKEIEAKLALYKEKLEKGKALYKKDKKKARKFLTAMGVNPDKESAKFSGRTVYHAAREWEKRAKGDYDNAIKAAEKAGVPWLHRTFWYSFTDKHGITRQFKCTETNKIKLDGLKAAWLFAGELKNMFTPIIEEREVTKADIPKTVGQNPAARRYWLKKKKEELAAERKTRKIRMSLQNMMNLAIRRRPRRRQAEAIAQAEKSKYLAKLKEAQKPGGGRVKFRKFQIGYPFIGVEIEIKASQKEKVELYQINWMLAEQGAAAITNDIAEDITEAYIDLCVAHAKNFNRNKETLGSHQSLIVGAREAIQELKRHGVYTKKCEELLMMLEILQKDLPNHEGSSLNAQLRTWNSQSKFLLDELLEANNQVKPMRYLEVIKKFARSHKDYEFAFAKRLINLNKLEYAESRLKRAIGLSEEGQLDIPIIRELRTMKPDEIAEALLSQTNKFMTNKDVAVKNFDAEIYLKGANLLVLKCEKVVEICKQNPDFRFSFMLDFKGKAIGAGADLLNGMIQKDKKIRIAEAEAALEKAKQKRNHLLVFAHNRRNKNRAYFAKTEKILDMCMLRLNTAQKTLERKKAKFGNSAERVYLDNVIDAGNAVKAQTGTALAAVRDHVLTGLYVSEFSSLGSEFKKAYRLLPAKYKTKEKSLSDARDEAARTDVELASKELDINNRYVYAKNLTLSGQAGVAQLTAKGGGAKGPSVSPHANVNPYAGSYASGGGLGSGGGAGSAIPDKDAPATGGTEGKGGTTYASRISANLSYKLGVDKDVPIARKIRKMAEYVLTDKDLALKEQLVALVNEMLKWAGEVKSAKEILNIAEYLDTDVVGERSWAGILSSDDYKRGIRSSSDLVTMSKRDLTIAERNFEDVKSRILDLLKTTNAKIPIFEGRQISTPERERLDKAEKEAREAYIKGLKRVKKAKKDGQFLWFYWWGHLSRFSHEVPANCYGNEETESMEVHNKDRDKLKKLKKAWLDARERTYSREVKLPTLDRFIILALKHKGGLKALKAANAILLLQKAALGGEGLLGRIIPKTSGDDSVLRIFGGLSSSSEGGSGFNFTLDFGIEWSLRLIGNTEGEKLKINKLMRKYLACLNDKAKRDIKNQINSKIDEINYSAKHFLLSARRVLMAKDIYETRSREFESTHDKKRWPSVAKALEEYKRSLTEFNRDQSRHKAALDDFVEYVRMCGIDEGKVFDVPSREEMTPQPSVTFKEEKAGLKGALQTKKELNELRKALRDTRNRALSLKARKTLEIARDGLRSLVGFGGRLSAALVGRTRKQTKSPDKNWKFTQETSRVHKRPLDLTNYSKDEKDKNEATRNIDKLFKLSKSVVDQTRLPKEIRRAGFFNIDDFTWVIIKSEETRTLKGQSTKGFAEEIGYEVIAGEKLAKKWNEFSQKTAKEMKAKGMDDETIKERLVLPSFFGSLYEGMLDQDEKGHLGDNTIRLVLGFTKYYSGMVRDALREKGSITKLLKDPTLDKDTEIKAFLMRAIDRDWQILQAGLRLYMLNPTGLAEGTLTDQERKVLAQYQKTLKQMRDNNLKPFVFNRMRDESNWRILRRNVRGLAKILWPGRSRELHENMWSVGRLTNLAELILSNKYTMPKSGATYKIPERAKQFIGLADRIRKNVERFSSNPYERKMKALLRNLVRISRDGDVQIKITNRAFDQLLLHITRGVKSNESGMIKPELMELERLVGLCNQLKSEGKAVGKQIKTAFVIKTMELMAQIETGRLLSTSVFLMELYTAKLPSYEDLENDKNKDKEIRFGWIKLGLENFKVEVHKDGETRLIPRAGTEIIIRLGTRTMQSFQRGDITYKVDLDTDTNRLSISPNISEKATVEGMVKELDTIYKYVLLVKNPLEKFFGYKFNLQDPEDFGLLYFYAVELVIKEGITTRELYRRLIRMKGIIPGVNIFFGKPINIKNPKDIGRLMALERAMRRTIDEETGKNIKRLKPLSIVKMNTILECAKIINKDFEKILMLGGFINKPIMESIKEAEERGDSEAVGEAMGLLMAEAENIIVPKKGKPEDLRRISFEQRIRNALEKYKDMLENQDETKKLFDLMIKGKKTPETKPASYVPPITGEPIAAMMDLDDNPEFASNVDGIPIGKIITASLLGAAPAPLKNTAQSKTNISLYLGLLSSITDEINRIGFNKTEGKAFIGRCINIVKSEKFSKYLKELSVSSDFRTDLAKSFVSKKQEDRNRFYDLMGRVTYFAKKCGNKKELDRELDHRMDVVKRFKIYFQSRYDPKKSTDKANASEIEKAIHNLGDFFKNLTFPPIMVGKEKVSNFYDASKTFYILTREAEIRNKGGAWTDKVRQREEEKFALIFFESTVLSLHRIIEDKISETEPDEIQRITLIDKLFIALKAVYNDLNGESLETTMINKLPTTLKALNVNVDPLAGFRYPIAEEVDTPKTKKDFRELCEWLEKEEVKIDKDALRKLFYENKMLEFAMFWVGKRFSDSDYHTINKMKDKIRYRKNAWKAYLAVKSELKTPVTSGEISFLADDFKEKTVNIKDIVFDRAVFIQDLARKRIYRPLLFDRLFHKVTIMNWDTDMYFRSLGNRLLWIAEWRMERSFGRMDDVEGMVKYKPTDVSMLKTDDETEKLRFALFSYAGKLARYIEIDSPLRNLLINALDNTTLEGKKDFKATLESVKPAQERLMGMFFKYKIEEYTASKLTSEDPGCYVDYIKRWLIARSLDEPLTIEEEQMTDEEFVENLADKFKLNDGIMSYITSSALKINGEYVDKLKKGQLTRTRLKAIYSDYAVICKTTKDKEIFDVELNATDLFAEITRQKGNSELLAIISTEQKILGHLISTVVSGGRAIELTNEEKALIPEDIRMKIMMAGECRDIKKQDVRLVLRSLVELIKIWQTEDLDFLEDKNNVTPEVMDSFLRMINDVHFVGLVRGDLITKEKESVLTEEMKKRKEKIVGAMTFNAQRHVDREMGETFHKRSLGNPEGTHISNIERNNAPQNIAKTIKYIGYLLLIITLWCVLRVLSAHIIAILHRRSARLVRDPDTNKVIGKLPIDRIKVDGVPKGFNKKMFFYYLSIVFLLVVSTIIYLTLIEFASTHFVIAAALAYLYFNINIGPIMTIADRFSTFSRAEPRRDRVKFNDDKLPSHMKIGMKMVSLEGTDSMISSVLPRLANTVRSQSDPNAFGMVIDDNRTRSEADSKRIINAMKIFEQRHGIRLYYVHRSFVGLEKKFGAHQEAYRFFYGGAYDARTGKADYRRPIAVAETDAERYTGRKLPPWIFIVGGLVGMVTVFILFSNFGTMGIWAGIGISMAFTFILALIFAGHTDVNPKKDRTKRPVYNRMYGDLNWIGFDVTAGSREIFDEDQIVNLKFQNDVADEMDSRYNRVWGFVIVDDKNWCGYVSATSDGQDYTSGREAGIREAIRQMLADQKRITSKSKQDREIERIVSKLRSHETSGELDDISFNEIAAFLRDYEKMSFIPKGKFQVREAIRIALELSCRVGSIKDLDEQVDSILADMKGKNLNPKRLTAKQLRDYFDANDLGDFDGIMLRWFMEEFGHYQPFRKAAEVMAHSNNRWAAYGNMFIEITGEETQWRQMSVRDAKKGICYDESKKRVLPHDNQYGKAMVVLSRWCRGTEPRGVSAPPGMFFLGTVGGALGFGALGFAFGLFSLLPPGLAAAGFLGFVGFFVGAVTLGAFEGRFYSGSFNALQVKDLTHDSREAAYAGSINVIRGAIHEPSCETLDDHIKRALKRWDRGEKRTQIYMFGPGMSISNRWHHFSAVRMYVNEIKFCFWLVLVVATVTASGVADTFAYVPSVLVWGNPSLAIALLVFILLAIVVKPNFMGGLRIPVLKYKLPWGYAERKEKNAVSIIGRCLSIVDGTQVYMNLPFIGVVTNIANKLRVEIIGPEPRELTQFTPWWRKLAAVLFVFVAPLILWWAPTILVSAFGISTITVLGITVSMNASLGICASILFVGFLVSKLASNPSPLLMCALVLLAPNISQIVYLIAAAALILFLAHRIFGRYFTIYWLLAGLVATTAIILIPFIPHLAGIAVPYIVNILIPIVVEAVVGFFAGAGVAGQVISFLTLHGSTVTLIAEIAFIILSYMIISALLRKILFDKDALLREALPWSTFMSVGGKSKALLAFVQAKRLKLSFIFGVFVLASACLMWSTAWTIVFMILLFSWFRGPIKAWMMAKKTEKGFSYVVRAIARVPFVGFPIATAIFGIYDLKTSFNDIWNAASNGKAIMNDLLDQTHSLFELHKALANIVATIGFCAGLAIFIWLIYVTPIGAGGLIAYIKFAGLIMAFSTIPLISSYVIIYVPLLLISFIRWVTALSGHKMGIGYDFKDVARDFAKSLKLDKLLKHLKNKEFDKVLDVFDEIINRVLHPFKHMAGMLSNTMFIIGLVIGMVISTLVLIDITLFAIYGMSMFSTGLIAFAGIAGSVILAFTIPLICGYLFAHFPAVAMAAVFWVAVNVFNVDARFGMELSLDIFGHELNADSINNAWLFLISPALLELIISQIIGVKDTIIGALKDLINFIMFIVTSIKSVIQNRFKRPPPAPAPTSPPVTQPAPQPQQPDQLEPAATHEARGEASELDRIACGAEREYQAVHDKANGTQRDAEAADRESNRLADETSRADEAKVEAESIATEARRKANEFAGKTAEAHKQARTARHEASRVEGQASLLEAQERQLIDDAATANRAKDQAGRNLQAAKIQVSESKTKAQTAAEKANQAQSAAGTAEDRAKATEEANAEGAGTLRSRASELRKMANQAKIEAREARLNVDETTKSMTLIRTRMAIVTTEAILANKAKGAANKRTKAARARADSFSARAVESETIANEAQNEASAAETKAHDAEQKRDRLIHKAEEAKSSSEEATQAAGQLHALATQYREEAKVALGKAISARHDAKEAVKVAHRLESRTYDDSSGGDADYTSPIEVFDQSIAEDIEWIQSDMGAADIVIGFPFFNEVPSGNVIRTGGGQVNAAELAANLAGQAHSFYPDKKVAIVIIGESNKDGKKYFDELNELLIGQDIESGQVQLFTFAKEKRFANRPELPQGKKWTTRALLKISQSLNADALFLVDGDVIVGPDWVKRFLEPTLTGQADVTSPDYARLYSTDDAAISDLIVQPLLAVTYGLLLQEPIAGDYGIKNTLFGMLLSDNELWVNPMWFETRFHAAVVKANKVVEEIHIPILKIHKANTLTQTVDRFHMYTGNTFDTLIKDNDFWRAQDIAEPPLLVIDSRGTVSAATRIDITPGMRQQGLIDSYGIGSPRLTNVEWCEALASGFYRYAAAGTIDARTQVLDDLKTSFVTRLVTLSEQIESENLTMVDLHHVFNEGIIVLHRLLRSERTSPVSVAEDKNIINESVKICEDTKNAAELLEQAIKELPWAGPIPMELHVTAQQEAASIETITSKIDSIVKNTGNAEMALNEINSHIGNIEIALRKLKVLGPEGNEYYKDVITKSLGLTMQKALELQARLQRVSEIIAEISANNTDYITENEAIISDLETINRRLGALRVRIEETIERIKTLRPFDVPRPERFRLDEIPREEELQTEA